MDLDLSSSTNFELCHVRQVTFLSILFLIYKVRMKILSISELVLTEIVNCEVLGT